MAVRDTHKHTSLPTRPHIWQVAGLRHTQTHIPAYKTAHMAGRRSETHTNTQSLPTRPHIWQVAGQTHTQTHNPCLQDRTYGRSPVRDTHKHTIPAYKTAHMAGRRSETHTNTQSLPTRPHIWQVAGLRHTQTHIPAYKTAHMAGRRSETHTNTHPCLQDRTYGRSPVRDTHKHTIPAYKTAHMAGRRSDTHTNTQSLPTRPHIWQVAGQRHTQTHNPCLQDRTYGRSPVRDTHKHTIPAYKTAHMAGRRSETHTNTQSLPTRPHIWQVAGQRHTQTHNPCLQDRTYGRSPVRDTHKHTSLPHQVC